MRPLHQSSMGICPGCGSAPSVDENPHEDDCPRSIQEDDALGVERMASAYEELKS